MNKLRFYELVFILRPDLSPTHVEDIANGYADVIKADNNGEVKKIEFCGLRSLAYRINKNKKGHYVLMNLNATPAAIHEVERQMAINENVLRYLSLRMETLDDSPSALMQQKGFREERFSKNRNFESRGHSRDSEDESTDLALEEEIA